MCEEGTPMFDLICLVLVLLFFAVSVSFVRGCETLENEQED